MGLVKKFIMTKELNMKRTVKKIVTPKPACVDQLAGLLDCYKRTTSGDLDTSCQRYRAALEDCVRNRKPDDTAAVKAKYHKELARFDEASRRHGFSKV